MVGARSFLKWTRFPAPFETDVAKIADEDWEVMESSWPKDLSRPVEEHTVRRLLVVHQYSHHSSLRKIYRESETRLLWRLLV
jgi:hypothetical protein